VQKKFGEEMLLAAELERLGDFLDMVAS